MEISVIRPRRSTLSVPGHVEKMHSKACQSSADVIMLDLEDSVPVEAKIDARSVVIRSLLSLDWNQKLIAVRTNALDTPFGYRDLLEVVESAGHLLDTIIIPKVNDPGDIYFASRMLDGIEMNKSVDHQVGIEASIETAKGLENVSAIAGTSHRLRTLVFGIADYTASIGARLVSISGHGEKEEEIYPGHRWHHALSRMVMAAKAHGLMAIDAPYGNFKDPNGLQRSAVMACALGCDGKWAIHPAQIDIINQVFSPSQEDIDRASKVLKEFEKSKNKGLGVVSIDGRMVDQATYRLAKQLWEQAKYLKMIEEGMDQDPAN